VSRNQHTLPPSYFEQRYQSDIDPWKFRTSDYERDKFAATVRALSQPTYRQGLEVGCSIGVLTGFLAPRCGRLLAIDASAIAIGEAKRLALPNVTFEVRHLPAEFPTGSFDLIVLSEVLYYFTKTDLARVADDCVRTLAANGEVILCHWLGGTDYPLAGDEASDLFAKAIETALPARTILHDDVYRLERFSR
jgi:SAM-dependent methyltransferase